ncbi:hypothetical protein HN51_061880, partial [Arachis hypogaea]
DVIKEVGLSNVVQIVTDNALVCKMTGLLIEVEFSSVHWTPCVVHNLNLTLKDICPAKNIEKNNFVYLECSMITQIAEDAFFIKKKKFIVNHHMRLLKQGVKEMVISENTNIDAHTLHLVHEMWDSMIKKVKSVIYLYERKNEQELSSFYNVVHSILIQRWTKTSTPLHCLAHSLNSRLLGQPSSSSCYERNWSIYSFIHSLKRNKLKAKRGKNLVFVHTIFRLLSRKNSTIQ